jgi:flagellar biogenesis protein FliO
VICLPRPADCLPRGLRGAIAIALILLVAGTAKSFAAAALPTDEQLESAPIGSDALTSSSEKSVAAPAPANSFDIPRVLLALTAVLALVFIMRGAFRRMVPGAAVHRSSSAVKIVARTSIAPRQHLLVIQFGKRLILVGDTGAHLNSLCEVTDPEEVASIVARTAEETISVARRFESLFGRARKEFSEEPPEPETFDPTNEIAAQNPTVDETKKELAGLREKVREVAQQFGSA